MLRASFLSQISQNMGVDGEPGHTEQQITSTQTFLSLRPQNNLKMPDRVTPPTMQVNFCAFRHSNEQTAVRCVPWCLQNNIYY